MRPIFLLCFLVCRNVKLLTIYDWGINAALVIHGFAYRNFDYSRTRKQDNTVNNLLFTFDVTHEIAAQTQAVQRSRRAISI